MFSHLKKDNSNEQLFDKKQRKEHKKCLGELKEDWEADAEGNVLSYQKMKYE